MKSVSLLLLGVGVGLLGFFGYSLFDQPTAAQRQARLQWEYASIVAVYSFSPYKDRVNKIFGMAEICYLQANGCRRAEIKHELDYGTYLQERAEQESFQTRKEASVKASEIAFQKAVSQLGGEGWEIVSEPQLNFEFVNLDDYNKFEDKSVLFKRETTRAIYFKRLRTQ